MKYAFNFEQALFFVVFHLSYSLQYLLKLLPLLAPPPERFDIGDKPGDKPGNKPRKHRNFGLKSTHQLAQRMADAKRRGTGRGTAASAAASTDDIWKELYGDRDGTDDAHEARVAKVNRLSKAPKPAAKKKVTRRAVKKSLP